MTEDAAHSHTNARSGELAVNTPVLVYPGTANQQGGELVFVDSHQLSVL